MFLDKAMSSNYKIHNFTHLNAAYALWSWDLEAPPLESSLGLEELKIWREKLHPEDAAAAYDKLLHFINSGEIFFENTYRIETVSGAYRYVFTKAIAERSKQGALLRMSGIHIDITDQMDMKSQIYRLSNYDEMTRLPNTSKLWADFDAYVAPHLNTKNIYMVCVDVDNFNYINNKLGYHVGNEIILKVVELLKQCTQPGDYLARVSGDEFVLVIARDFNTYDINRELKGFLDFMRSHLRLEAYHAQITVSAGCSVYLNHAQNLHTLMQKANTALHYAKKQGKDQYRIYEKDLESDAYRTIEWKQQLKESIRNNELGMYYQPIYACASGELVGFESLCRWYHKVQGYVPPSVFIKIAEESDLIIELEKWIIREVFQQVQHWNQRFKKHFFVSINLSAKCMTAYDLPEYLSQLLRYYTIRIEQVEFEITETSVLKNLNLSMKTLNALKGMGFKIALDDFGTGYSSLNYLRSLPIDKVKLDKTFIECMTTDEKDQFLVKTIIDLSRGMALKTVAEGVETDEQILLLRRFNCDFLQGYFYSRPLHVDDVEKLKGIL